MFHYNSNVICVKYDFKNVKTGMDILLANHMAGLLKRINATMQSVEDLVESMKRDFVS